MFKEEKKNEEKMRSSVATPSPKTRGDQNLLVIPRQYVVTMANLDTSERNVKKEGKAEEEARF